MNQRSNTTKTTRQTAKDFDASETALGRKVSLGGAIIISFVTMALGIGIGINWDKISSNFLPYLGVRPTGVATLDWSPLNEVYDTLVMNYDGDIDKDAIIEGAKKGLVEAVGDPYTSYMTAKETTDFEKSLHGEVGSGVGIVMAKRDGYVRVTRTLPDNPARKAGVLAGDIIYKVDDEEVYSLDPTGISSKLKGSAGTSVKLTVVRDGQEKTFTMVREEINNVSADITYEGKTAIITTTRFDTNTGTLIEGFAKDFNSKGINKVILDLRNNGGGYVSAAKDLLSLWIDSELVLTQKSSNSSDVKTYAAHGKAVLANMKTVVLVNGSTASASEIVAGALKDYGKATIIGEQTYGKGVVQTLKYLSNSTLLKVTSAHWYTPKGTTINGTGITPDKKVENTYDDINKNKDPQLDAAKAL